MPKFSIDIVNEDTDEVITVKLEAEDVFDAHSLAANMAPYRWVNYITVSDESKEN